MDEVFARLQEKQMELERMRRAISEIQSSNDPQVTRRGRLPPLDLKRPTTVLVQ